MNPNQEQIDFWNGPRGAQWVADQELLDRQLAPFGEAALRAAQLAPGERVIDIGCGCGGATLAVAAAVGAQGSVLGVDISRPMLARAAERAAALPYVRFVCSDATTYAFDGQANCLFSRFGVMFFADPRGAFTHLRRALVPGGRLAFVCWRALAENEWMSVPITAVGTVVPPTPAQPDAPGPFAFADAARVRGILESSGFQRVVFAPFDHIMNLGNGRGLDVAAAEAVSLGPAARMLLEADAATKARAESAVRAALTPYVREQDVPLRAATWIVTASAT